MTKFYAHGKLLLSGEYAVLDGAKALAIPTRLGQHLQLTATQSSGLSWRSLDQQGNCWLEAYLGPQAEDRLSIGQENELKRLREILDAAILLRPDAASLLQARTIETRLEFDRRWGLGSSSSLIALLAQYLEVNPYQLLAKTFGGSGYDLACAVAEGPLSYQLSADFALPQVQALSWSPAWLDQSYFVYLGRKQNSREGIRHYRQQRAKAAEIDRISQLTDALIEAAAPAEVQKILHEHEQLIGQMTRQAPVQQRLFPDFPGQLKSLGAWGGDFIWAVSEVPATAINQYFQERGLSTVLPYRELAL